MSSNARCIWPSQRMTWWMRPGPSRFCAMRKPSPGSPSDVRDRHAHVGEARLAVRAPAAALVAHHRDLPHELVARRVGRDEDHRRALVRLRVGLGDDHDDAEAAPSAPDENHLCALITHSSPSRTARAAQQRRVGAGDLRLGHPEERARLAGDERLEELLLLLVGPEQVEDLAVAGVGRLAAEDELRDECCGRSPRSGTRTRGSRCPSRPPPAAGAAPRGPRPSPSAAARR